MVKVWSKVLILVLILVLTTLTSGFRLKCDPATTIDKFEPFDDTYDVGQPQTINVESPFLDRLLKSFDKVGGIITGGSEYVKDQAFDLVGQSS